MSSTEELGTALECVTGARQALRRVMEANVDDALVSAVHQIDIHLSEQFAELAALSIWRRGVER
jgi:hypothetical protein